MAFVHIECQMQIIWIFLRSEFKLWNFKEDTYLYLWWWKFSIWVGRNFVFVVVEAIWKLSEVLLLSEQFREILVICWKHSSNIQIALLQTKQKPFYWLDSILSSKKVLRFYEPEKGSCNINPTYMFLAMLWIFSWNVKTYLNIFFFN